ncbi:hypothetical protein DFH09DRAFT_1306480 [Mycena vulgaris]|nr:hypothetical protein DFH09DRAFT_1306480 [Mycena vulgaris]
MHDLPIPPSLPHAAPQPPSAICLDIDPHLVVVCSLPLKQVSHHPHIPADQYVLLWTLLHSSSVRDHLLNTGVGADLQASIFQGLLYMMMDKMHEVYSASLLHFVQFCDHFAIGKLARMPTDGLLLAAFIAEAIGTYSDKCIHNWPSTLRLWHLYNLTEWNGDDACLPSLKKAGDHMGAPFKYPPCKPITKSHLCAIHNSLNLTTGFGAAAWSNTTSPFRGCRCLGKFVIESANKFSPKHDMCISRAVTKITNIASGKCILTEVKGADVDLCLVWAFKNHLAVNNAPPLLTPIFAFREHGVWCPLVKDYFLHTTAAIFTSALLDSAGLSTPPDSRHHGTRHSAPSFVLPCSAVAVERVFSGDRNTIALR